MNELTSYSVLVSAINPPTEVPSNANTNDKIVIVPNPSIVTSPELAAAFTDYDVARAQELNQKLISEDGIPIFPTDEIPPLPSVPEEQQAKFYAWLKEPRTFSCKLEGGFEVKMTVSLWTLVEYLNIAGEQVLRTGREPNRWVGSSLIYELGEIYVRHVLAGRDVPSDIIETILQSGVRRRLQIDPMDRDLRVYVTGANEQQLAEIIGQFELALIHFLPKRLQKVQPNDKELLEILSQTKLPPYIKPPYSDMHLQLWLVKKMCFKYSLPDNQNGGLLQSMSLARHTIQKDGVDIEVPGGTIDLSCAAKMAIPNGFEEDELYCPFDLDESIPLQPTGGELFKGWQWMMNYISNTRQVSDPLRIPHNYRSFLKRLVHYLKGARGLVRGDEVFLASTLTNYEGLDVAVSKGLGKHLPKTLASCIALTFQGCLLLRRANPHTDLTDAWKVEQKQFALLRSSIDPMFWKNAEHPLLSLLGLALSVHGLPFDAVAAAVEFFALIAVCTKRAGRCNDTTQVLLTKHEKALALQVKVSTPSQAFHLLLPFNPRTLVTRLQPLMDTPAGRGFLQGLSRTGLPIGAIENDIAGPVHQYLEKKGVSPFIFHTQALELLQSDAKGINFSLTLGLYSIWKAFHPKVPLAPELLDKMPALLELTKEKNGRTALLKQVAGILSPSCQKTLDEGLERLTTYPEALGVWIEMLALSDKVDLVAYARQLYRQAKKDKLLTPQSLQQAGIAIVTGLQVTDVFAAADLLRDLCQKSGDGKDNLWRCLQTLLKATQASKQTLALDALACSAQQLLDVRQLEVAAEESIPLTWLAEQLIAENNPAQAKNILDKLIVKREWKANRRHLVHSWVKMCAFLVSQKSQDRFSDALIFYKKGLDNDIPLEDADTDDLKYLAQIISQYTLSGKTLTKPLAVILQKISSLVESNADSLAAIESSYSQSIKQQIINRNPDDLRASLAQCRSKLPEAVLIELLPDAIDLLLDCESPHDAEIVLEWFLEVPQEDSKKNAAILKVALQKALKKPVEALKFLQKRPIVTYHKSSPEARLDAFLSVATQCRWTINDIKDVGRALVRSLTKEDDSLAIVNNDRVYEAITIIAGLFVSSESETSNAIITHCTAVLSEILQRALLENQYALAENILHLMGRNNIASTMQATTCQAMFKAICIADLPQATSLLKLFNKYHEITLGSVRTIYLKAIAHVTNEYVKTNKNEEAFVVLAAESALLQKIASSAILEAIIKCAAGFLTDEKLERCLATLELTPERAYNTPESRVIWRSLALQLLKQKDWEQLAKLLQQHQKLFEKCEDATFSARECATQAIEGLLSIQPNGDSLRTIGHLSQEWPVLTPTQWISFCELCKQHDVEDLVDTAWKFSIPKDMHALMFEAFSSAIYAAEIEDALKLLTLFKQCHQHELQEDQSLYFQAVASVANQYLQKGQHAEAFKLLQSEMGSQSRLELQEVLTKCASSFLQNEDTSSCLEVLKSMEGQTLSPDCLSVWREMTQKIQTQKAWSLLGSVLQQHKKALECCEDESFDAAQCAFHTVDALMSEELVTEDSLRLVKEISKQWPVLSTAQWIRYFEQCTRCRNTLLIDEAWDVCVPGSAHASIFERLLAAIQSTDLVQAQPMLAMLKGFQCGIEQRDRTIYFLAVADIVMRYASNNQAQEALDLLRRESADLERGLPAIMQPAVFACAATFLKTKQLTACQEALELIRDDVDLSTEILSAWADMALQLWKQQRWLALADLFYKHPVPLQRCNNDKFDATRCIHDVVDSLLAENPVSESNLRVIAHIAKKWPLQPGQWTTFFQDCGQLRNTDLVEEIWDTFVETGQKDLACWDALVEFALTTSETIRHRLLTNPIPLAQGLNSCSKPLQTAKLYKKLVMGALAGVANASHTDLVRSAKPIMEQIEVSLDAADCQEIRAGIVIIFAGAAWIAGAPELAIDASQRLINVLPQCSWEANSSELLMAIEGLMGYAKCTEEVESITMVCDAIQEGLLPAELMIALAASLMTHSTCAFTDQVQSLVSMAINSISAKASAECSKNLEDILVALGKSSTPDLDFIQRCITSENAKYFDPLAILQAKDQWFVARIKGMFGQSPYSSHDFLIEYIHALPSLHALIGRKELLSFEYILILILRNSESILNAYETYLVPLFNQLPDGYLSLDDNQEGCNYDPPENPTFVLEWMKAALVRDWQDHDAAITTYGLILDELECLADSRVKEHVPFHPALADAVSAFIEVGVTKPTWLKPETAENNAVKCFNQWASVFTADEKLAIQVMIPKLRKEIPSASWNQDAVQTISELVEQTFEFQNVHVFNNAIEIIQTYLEKAPLSDLEAIIPAFESMTIIAQNNLLVQVGIQHPFEGLRKALLAAFQRKAPVDLCRRLTELLLDAIVTAKVSDNKSFAVCMVNVLQAQGNIILRAAAELKFYVGHEAQWCARMDSMMPINVRALQQFGRLQDAKVLLEALEFYYQSQLNPRQGPPALKWTLAFLERWINSMKVDGENHIESLFNASGLINEASERLFTSGWPHVQKALALMKSLKAQFRIRMKAALKFDPALFQPNENSVLSENQILAITNQLVRGGVLISHGYWHGVYQEVGDCDGEKWISDWTNVAEKFFQWNVSPDQVTKISHYIEAPLLNWSSTLSKEKARILKVKLKLANRWLKLIEGLSQRNPDQDYKPLSNKWSVIIAASMR